LELRLAQAGSKRKSRELAIQKYIGGKLNTKPLSIAFPENNRALIATKRDAHLLRLLGYTERSHDPATNGGTFEAKKSGLVSLATTLHQARILPVPAFFAPNMARPSDVHLAMQSSGVRAFAKLLGLEAFIEADQSLTLTGTALTTRLATLAPWLHPNIRHLSPFKKPETTDYEHSPPIPPFLTYLPARRVFLFLDDESGGFDQDIVSLGFTRIKDSAGGYQTNSPAAARGVAALGPVELKDILDTLKSQWPFNFHHLTCDDIHGILTPKDQTHPGRTSKSKTKPEISDTEEKIDYDPGSANFVTQNLEVARKYKLSDLRQDLKATNRATTNHQLKRRPLWGFPDLTTALRFRDILTDEAEAEVMCRLIENTVISGASLKCPPKPSSGYSYDPFQIEGIRHMDKGPTILIADDMGTGKTVISVGQADKIRTQQPDQATHVLVISQADQLDNWTRTLTLFPSIPFRVIRLDVPSKTAHLGKIEYVTQAPKSSIDPRILCKNGSATVVSYNTIMTNPGLAKLPWDLMILDECHNIKTPSSQRTQAILGSLVQQPDIRAKSMIWMTGTDITDTPMDFYPFASTAVWRSGYEPTQPERFSRLFCPTTRPTKDHQHGLPDHKIDGTGDAIRTRRIARLALALDLGPRLRRLKEHVYQDELLPKSRKAWLVPINDPTIIEHANTEARIFDELSSGANDINTRLALKTFQAARIQTGIAKIPFIVKAVQRVTTKVDPILLFCHHKTIANALHEALIKANIDSIVVHGSNTSPNERARLAYRFNAGEWTIMIATIASLNAGHTITRTRHVWFAELDHKGKLIEQCEDRAWRRGQKRNVRIRYFHIKNSYDGRVVSNIMRKAEIAEIASGDDRRRIINRTGTERLIKSNK
jgi:superfamily II DNA or RNA helicase